MTQTTDFGAPTAFGVHCFYVHIPASPREAVQIYEDYGFNSDDNTRETTECRSLLARELWTKIKDSARRDFNDRLKAKKQSTGTWKTGTVKLDRFLGRELCVLAWSAEHASPAECAILCQKWLALRPEERWWLYAKTAATARLAEQSQHGWRKALYCALSDGDNITLKQKIKPKTKPQKDEEINLMDIFDFVNDQP